MSQENEHTSPDGVAVQEGIHPEASPFEPGYQPESLPRISVPNLAPDAQGMSAEALANVPTLMDEVHVESEIAMPVVAELPQASVVVELVTEVSANSPESEAAVQDLPTQADTWTEELHVRMGKLTDEIHTLNARLDRLEAKNKAKA